MVSTPWSIAKSPNFAIVLISFLRPRQSGWRKYWLHLRCRVYRPARSGRKKAAVKRKMAADLDPIITKEYIKPNPAIRTDPLTRYRQTRLAYRATRVQTNV